MVMDWKKLSLRESLTFAIGLVVAILAGQHDAHIAAGFVTDAAIRIYVSSDGMFIY